MIVALLGLVVTPCFAQQDPNDPGLPDSVIVGSAHVDSSGTFAYVPIYAVTDDSVVYYNLPLGWSAPQGGVHAAAHTQYFYPLTSWAMTFDSVFLNQCYVRHVGWCWDLDSDSTETPPLFTDGLRIQIMSVRFIIDPEYSPQLVVLDTTWDDRNGSLIFGLVDGATEIIPAFQRGFISIYPVGVDDEFDTPTDFSLSQNYPNPFNPTTNIEFALPQESHTQLVIYNLLGQTVKTLIDEVKSPGVYSITWDGTDNSGNPQPSGTYFYRLTSMNFSETKKMILLM